MKNITDQAKNRVTIVGKLLDVTFNKGVTKTSGVPWESAKLNIRVTHTYGGQQETSDIPVSMFATQYTSKGGLNPAFTSIQKLKEFKTAQNVGFDMADTVRCDGRSTILRENNFVSKSGQLVNTWQINASFISQVSAAETATFDIDIFMMDKRPEMTKDEDPTGRLILKGGIVQYGGKLDVVEFIVEGPEQVDYIERNWEENTTINVQGRIRVTSIEEKSSHTSSWGEDIPDSNTRMVRELIVTTGDDEPKDEEFSYNVVDIKKAFNERQALLEQLRIDAKNNTKPAAPAANPKQFDWE